ncbi:MAG: response regulator transcription factor [Candidatus Omnitrophica bacterium]|nr:response regulator transcription factor [Candidatus Omnitrophota bacterium]MDE2008860.1 response regulator transcription factor [Candidatus Omnitrophota bacterium]MDE2213577.1 response regulator transcription factor [Candidatus Omnitrophota bacterium]MDE2230522.1 response regulator transcription factor [Candidatus Omnitrophota bacterium]
MRILLVEDERKLASLIKRALKEASYAVDFADNSVDALFLAESNPYDLIILDIMIPGKDGIAICRQLRKEKVDVPILILTARNEMEDKISGLDAGADDYLTKPFFFPELLARVRALLRRRTAEKSTCLNVADLELNQLTRKVRRAGKEIELTPTEYSLLEFLMLNAGQVVTRTMISEHIWNDDFDAYSNVINVFIKNLRKKIDQGHVRELIRSRRGIGYILSDQ